jgi:uncharacterized protein YqhQ
LKIILPTPVTKVTYTTYLGLVAISSLGAPFALLLSQPQDVVRSNGTKITYLKKTSLAIEARAIWKQLRNNYMLLLIPVFLAGQFGATYQGNYLTCMHTSLFSLFLLFPLILLCLSISMEWFDQS